jgi:trehalose/maltose transport system substrate-binding protein
MFKRWVVLALIAVLALGLVPAVGAQGSSTVDCGTDQPVNLTFIAGQVGSEYDVAVALADMYMKACPNVAIAVVTRPTSTTDTLAQYQQFLGAKSPAIDVFQIDVAWPSLVAEGMVDMSQYVDQSFLSQFPQGVLDAYTVGGRLVGLPWFVGTGMLYFRTDLLQKYNLQPPQTWDELASEAQTIQDGERAAGNKDFWGFVFQGAAYEGLTCDALEWQVSSGGGKILGSDGTIEVTDPNTIAIFDEVASWVGKIVPPEVLNYQEEDSRAVWQAGNAAFMRNWGYAYPLGQAADSVIKDKFDVSALPGKTAGMSAATLGGWGVAVSQYSNNVPAAAAFVAWLVDEPQAVYYTLQRGTQPAIDAVYDNPDVAAQLPYVVKFRDALSFATPRPTVVAGSQYATVSEDYYTAVHDVLAGSKDAKTAMSDLELQLADLGFKPPAS